MTNFKIEERIIINGFTNARGTIKEIKNKRIYVLLDSTTTGNLSAYSLRSDDRFVAVGYSQDDASYGGWFFNKNINEF